jgi:hypothetical protein
MTAEMTLDMIAEILEMGASEQTQVRLIKKQLKNVKGAKLGMIAEILDSDASSKTKIQLIDHVVYSKE